MDYWMVSIAHCTEETSKNEPIDAQINADWCKQLERLENCCDVATKNYGRHPTPDSMSRALKHQPAELRFLATIT
jgi:hypothetical protein